MTKMRCPKCNSTDVVELFTSVQCNTCNPATPRDLSFALEDVTFTLRNRINARLLDGTGQAFGENTCLYRDETGRKCAVGCLIPDSVYDPTAENLTVDKLCAEAGVWKSNTGGAEPLANMLNNAGIPATEEIRMLLIKAQTYHDNPKNWYGTDYIGLRV